MTELKPCPFCGKKAKCNGSYAWCSAINRECAGSNWRYLLELWNRRSETYELGAAIMRLRENMDTIDDSPKDILLWYSATEINDMIQAAIDAAEGE